jgi:hypothetical protein
LLGYKSDPPGYGLGCEGPETINSTTGLYGLDDLGGIIAGKDEPGSG